MKQTHCWLDDFAPLSTSLKWEDATERCPSYSLNLFLLILTNFTKHSFKYERVPSPSAHLVMLYWLHEIVIRHHSRTLAQMHTRVLAKVSAFRLMLRYSTLCYRDELHHDCKTHSIPAILRANASNFYFTLALARIRSGPGLVLHGGGMTSKSPIQLA